MKHVECTDLFVTILTIVFMVFIGKLVKFKPVEFFTVKMHL